MAARSSGRPKWPASFAGRTRSIYQEALLRLDYTLALYWRLRHSLHFDDPEKMGTVLTRHEELLRPIVRKMREQPAGSLPDSG